jgi:DNA-binding GntR family transcriptional regulator
MRKSVYETLPSIAHRSLNEKVYEMIQQAILEEKIKPGEKLNVVALAEKFEVSRTPVTWALHKLAFEGIVQIYERRKTCVITLTPEMVEQTFDLRRVLEVYAAEKIIRLATEDQIHSLESLIKLMEESNEYIKFLEADRLFHETFVDIANNKRLSEMYRSLHSHSQVILRYYSCSDKRREETFWEHQEIVELMKKRQYPELVRCLENHINTVKNYLIGVI